MLLGCEEEILNYKVVRRNVLGILVSENDIFGIVNHEVHIEKFLPFCFDLLLRKVPASQLGDLHLEVEDNHTVLPSLQMDALWYYVGL